MQEEKISSQGFFSKVRVGDRLPSLHKDAVMLDSTYRLPALYGDIELENDKKKAMQKARKLAVDPIHVTSIFGGPYLLQFLSQMITNWLTDPRGWLQGGKLSCKFIRLVKMGEKITCQGQIKSKHIEKGRRSLVCDVWIENCIGQPLVIGEAAINF